jgi:hypothetical protein
MKLFGDLNHGLLGPPGDGNISVLSDFDEEEENAADTKVPLLYQYWKSSTVTDKDIFAYHVVGWLPGVLLCTPTTLYFSAID